MALSLSLPGIIGSISAFSYSVEEDGLEPVITRTGGSPTDTISITIGSGTYAGTYTQDVRDSSTITVAEAEAAPVPFVAPTFTGTETEGETLTGLAPLYIYDGADQGDITFQWRNSVSGDISGATSLSYVLQASDVGDTVTLRASYGGVTVDSAASGTIAAAVSFSIARHGTFIDSAPGDLAVSRSDSVDVGTAATGRRIWFFGGFVFGGGGGNEVVTMDGQTMTRIATDRGETPIFYLDSDSVGGTVTISITDPENQIWPCGGVVYSTIGHTQTDISNVAATPAAPSVDQFAGGATIGIGMNSNGGSTTWSPDPGNRFVDTDLRSNEYFSAWDDLSTSAATGTSFSVSNSLSAEQVALVFSIA